VRDEAVRIRAAVSRFEEFALTRPYAIALQEATSRVANGIVRIDGESGASGWGAASPAEHVTGETLEDCRAALSGERLAWLSGRDVRTLPALCREARTLMAGAPAALAAVDMALHDLLAQHLGVPVVEMLGRAHEELPTSITIGIKPVPETLAEADEYRGRGFRVLKVKTGNSLEEDLARLARLREHCGASITIRADANQGYTPEETARFFERSAGLDVEFVEQPVPRGQLRSLRERLSPDWLRRIAADESLHDEKDALRLSAPEPACGIYNIKLMKCGGLRSAARIAAVAETAGVALMWGCMDESRISIAAALHAAFASPATRYLDLDGSLDLARDVADGGFTMVDGRMRTTDAPGLGLRALD
jgi:L-alanine-DL-glutamate epimerase-like enolase superfamily enzyme